MISQFFILSPRGDSIVSKDYRGEVVRGTAEIFFRKIKGWVGGSPPPIFNVEGIHFLYIRRGGLYFVCTTKYNVQPTTILELLVRIAALCKDYCGALTEETIRRNFVLIYELLDEVIDFGYAQVTQTESLKAFIHNEPVILAPVDTPSATKHAPSGASSRPVALRFSDQRDRKNEIFLDLLERLTVLFNATGSVLRAEIDGSIQMKCFLAGNPQLQMGLNEDLQVGRGKGVYGLVLDDCNFHECVKLDQFDSSRTLVLKPPDGEFTVMNYRITGNFQNPLPFRASLTIEPCGLGRVDVILRLDCDMPSKCHGTNITVRCPMPRQTSSCGYELGSAGQSLEYKKEEKVAVWKITQANGGIAYYTRLKLMLPDEEKHRVKHEVGPISVEFEVPMYVCSGMNVRFLRVYDGGRDVVPFRWVRYISHSDSYVIRV